MHHAISNTGSLEAQHYREQDRRERLATAMKLRRDRLRDEFDVKDLYDCLGDDDALLTALCEQLLPLVTVDTWKLEDATLRGIAEALQNITEKAIAARVAKEIADAL